MMEDESQYRNNLSVDDIDLSLLRLNSPPYDYSSFSSEVSPLKRSSPVSDESDHPKRRKLSLQIPILITSPPETRSSSIFDPTRYQNPAVAQTRCSYASPVSKTPSPSKTPDTETMTMMNERIEEMNREKTNYGYEYEKQQEEAEDDCGEGMRIERSGEGFVIRLKCRCRQAFRVLFSDHHLYFKPL